MPAEFTEFWAIQGVMWVLSDSDQPIWDFSSLGMWESLQHWHLLAEKETAGTNLQLQNYRMSVRPRSDHRMQRKGPWLRKSLGQDHIEQERRCLDLSPYLFLAPFLVPPALRGAEKRAELRQGWGHASKPLSVCAFSALSLSCMWWGFLSLSTSGIWGWIIPFCLTAFGCPVFSSILGLYPVDASSTPSVLWQPKMSHCCSVAKSCPTLCDRMDCSMPGSLVLHCLSEFAQTLVTWIGDAI